MPAPTPVGATVHQRRAIDLEDLVEWTIRTQRADRDRVSLHAVELAAAAAIRRSHRPAGSFDAPAGWGVDSCVRVAEIGLAGTRVDGGGQIRGVAPRLHPDAEAVIAAIDRAFGSLKGWRRCVLDQARVGGRPLWNLGAQRFVPVKNTAPQGGGRRHVVMSEWETVPPLSVVARRMIGRGIRIVDDRGRRKFQQAEPGFSYRTLDDGSRQVVVRWSAVELLPSDAEIRDAREEYAAWHAGMMRVLGELLEVPLRDYRVTGFAAPAMPWIFT
ncbi:hypothetical protein FBZ84_103431 [Azospirillum baldaniorum]|uniref:hypothetical protein n=1 Tax=Azospirillum baldaniorum TaxID=1064539 RepID=UPI0011A19173|nr:hypothetical protein [Azospirillum baldaniorum]TWA69714.1 hypothetical protein FBZ84_103431 [Azospirillum baldaniorum]